MTQQPISYNASKKCKTLKGFFEEEEEETS